MHSNKENVTYRHQLKKEQREAVYIVWTVITIVSFAVIIFPFFTNNETVLKNSPTCISIGKYNRECCLCGMTRAFIEISNGNFRNAISLNKGSIPLFFIITINAIVYIINLINRMYSTKR
ncbi:MAG: DUF2752 domain-containing protein [Erysipelotrichia bacterium]|nr:DUF2752 domain-containing protein [Erysipelotrichia bacterium]